jgi:Telomere resolvase
MSRKLKPVGELQNTYVDERVKVLIPKFEALAPYNRKDRENGKRLGSGEKLDGWRNLAVYESKILKMKYPDSSPDHEKTYGSATSQISKLKKALKTEAKKLVKDHANYHPVQTIITHFGDALSYLFREYKSLSNEKNREAASERTEPENRIELDLTPYLKEAHRVLTLAADGATLFDVEWRDVSCAIALCCGRRMAEIHLSGEFEVVGDYHLSFKGQLKGKARKVKVTSDIGKQEVLLRDYEFTIPTLVRAELVAKGIGWLEANGKRFPRDEKQERVNGRWSKVLSERVRDEWNLFEGMTYHKFRGAYFAASIRNAENEGSIKSVDYERYAFRILGDNDSETVGRYKRFDIKPGAITRI